MFNRCKHNWEKVSEITTESHLEQMKRLGLTPEAYYLSTVTQTYILVLKCTKCGVLDKTIKVLDGL